MTLEEFREICLSYPLTEECFPFDQRILVFKVAGKMFALCNVEEFESINLKCDPEKALEWREQYPSVQPGYHMNKTHWNTLLLHGELSGRFLREAIDESYQRVVDGLPVKIKKQIRG